VPVEPSLYLRVTKNAQGLDGSLIAPVFHSAMRKLVTKTRCLENFTGTSTALSPFVILKTPLAIWMPELGGGVEVVPRPRDGVVDGVVAELLPREGGTTPGLVEAAGALTQAAAAAGILDALGPTEAEAESGAICVKAAATVVMMRMCDLRILKTVCATCKTQTAQNTTERGLLRRSRRASCRRWRKNRALRDERWGLAWLKASFDSVGVCVHVVREGVAVAVWICGVGNRVTVDVAIGDIWDTISVDVGFQKRGVAQEITVDVELCHGRVDEAVAVDVELARIAVQHQIADVRDEHPRERTRIRRCGCLLERSGDPKHELRVH
jgi:hypothetical protein